MKHFDRIAGKLWDEAHKLKEENKLEEAFQKLKEAYITVNDEAEAGSDRDGWNRMEGWDANDL